MSTKRGWKQTLFKVTEMRGTSGLAAYDRTKLLLDVFDDRDFRADAGALDDFEAADKLDMYCEDLSFGFLDLKSMIEHFPQRDQWKDGLLRRMYQEMIEARKPTDKPARKSPERVTKEQFAAVTQEKDSLKTRAEYLSRDLTASQARIDQLESENRDLREQLARAEGRISAMEKIMDRDGVAV